MEKLFSSQKGCLNKTERINTGPHHTKKDAKFNKIILSRMIKQENNKGLSDIRIITIAIL